jgi:hypothetical protein
MLLCSKSNKATASGIERATRGVGDHVRGVFTSNNKVLLLSLSATIGAVFGAIFFPTWHHAIESAQALAGLVPYADDNPFYLYHRNTWSALHQLLALPLLLGITERSLAFILSGLIGAISYWAISYTAWNLRLRNAAILLIPVVIHLGRLNDYGPLYPVWIMGSHSSYGIIGLMLNLASFNLLADGKKQLSGMLLGISFCMHPLLTAYAATATFLAAIVSRPVGRRVFCRDYLRGFLLGTSASAISFVVFCWMRIPFPPVDESNQAHILRMFTDYWGSHHRRLPLLSIGTGMALFVLLTPIILPRFRRNLLTVLFSIASAGGLLLGAASWLPERVVPLFVDSILPVRYVSFAILFFPIFALTMLFRRNHAFAVGFSLIVFFYWTTHLAAPAEPRLLLLLLLSLLTAYGWPARKHSRRFLVPSVLITVSLFFCPLAAHRFHWAPSEIDYRFPSSGIHGEMLDRTNDEFWKKVSEDKGNLLYADMDCIQLFTRRPVLISAAINQISYVPQTGPLINRILKDLCNLDITAPPNSPYTRSGRQDGRLYLEMWKARTEDEWIRIREEYDVTDVLIWRPNKLHLPKAAETPRFRYYHIPEKIHPKSDRPIAHPELTAMCLQAECNDPLYGPQNLINEERFWEVAQDRPQYVIAALNQPLTLSRMALSSGVGEVQRMPARIDILGSNDGAAWQSIASIPMAPWQSSTTREIPIPHQKAFSQYKFSFEIANPEKIVRIYAMELSFLEADMDQVTSSGLPQK